MRRTLLGDYADGLDERACFLDGLADQILGNPEHHTDPLVVEAGREACRRVANYHSHAELVRRMIKRNRQLVRGPR